MELVRLGPGDAGEVLTLQRAAYVTEAQAHGDLLLPPLTETLDELGAALGDADLLALGWRDDAGRLVGAVRARAARTAGEIARLTVAPDRQREGLGRRLLQAAEDALPGHVTELRLFTGEHSTGNLRLYQRSGYVESGRVDSGAGYQLVHLRKRRAAAAGG